MVPNELSPSTFGELEALKAQAVAARTYIVANLGQSREEGYDICDTDACQVYLGAGTEDPLATQAVVETRGMVATYEGQPIKALYSSTCGGRTENSENIFEERLPYLRSVVCEFDHLEALPFATTRTIANYRERCWPSPACPRTRTRALLRLHRAPTPCRRPFAARGLHSRDVLSRCHTARRPSS